MGQGGLCFSMKNMCLVGRVFAWATPPTIFQNCPPPSSSVLLADDELSCALCATACVKQLASSPSP